MVPYSYHRGTVPSGDVCNGFYSVLQGDDPILHISIKKKVRVPFQPPSFILPLYNNNNNTKQTNNN